MVSQASVGLLTGETCRLVDVGDRPKRRRHVDLVYQTNRPDYFLKRQHEVVHHAVRNIPFRQSHGSRLQKELEKLKGILEWRVVSDEIGLSTGSRTYVQRIHGTEMSPRGVADVRLLEARCAVPETWQYPSASVRHT